MGANKIILVDARQPRHKGMTVSKEMCFLQELLYHTRDFNWTPIDIYGVG